MMTDDALTAEEIAAKLESLIVDLYTRTVATDPVAKKAFDRVRASLEDNRIQLLGMAAVIRKHVERLG